MKHDGGEDYDFEKGGIGDWLGANDLVDADQANNFSIERNWQQSVEGTVKVISDDVDGLTLGQPDFTWRDVK